MSEILPCLLRIGDNVKKYKVFKLDRKQVTIGRSGEVTYAILSNMISRCHAILKQQDDNTWSITDNKSLNGVYVNGRQLSPHSPYILQEGDMVQLGVPTSADVPAEYIYKFYSALKVRREKTVKRAKSDHPEEEEKRTLSFSESSEHDDDREMKRKIPQNKSHKVEDDSKSNELKKRMEEEQAKKEAEYKSRLAEMEKLLKEKEEEQLKIQQQLERERQEKENQAKEVEELKMKEMVILMEMEDKEKQLEKEKEELKLKMQAELETSLKEREAALLSQLNAQKEAVLNEKKQIEESLQREMAKALEEKDKELEQNLLEQKEKLEKVLEKKEMEQKVLEAQLNETKEKSETHALKAKEEILSNFVDLMEMELQCSICSELLIKATSLNCSHTFCKLCINQWLKVKKECPNCRKAVTTQMQALALDSYIDKMVEQLSEELKQKRAELVAQRKIEQDQFDGLMPGPSGGATPRPSPIVPIVVHPVQVVQPVRASTRTTRGRRRGRGGRATPALTRPAEPIVIEDPAPTPAANLAAPQPPPVVSNTETSAIELSDEEIMNSIDVERLGSDDVEEEPGGDDVEEEPDDDDDDDEDNGDDDDNNDDGTSLTDSDENDSDSDSINGDEGAYYGGYGRCYNCGRRGHWANGCPF